MANRENQKYEKTEKTTKVLIFAPPKICFHQPYKKIRIENQDAQNCWDKTLFHFIDGKLVKTSPKDHCDLESTIATEDSCILLEYDPKLIQESVNSYLDQVFSEPSCMNDSCCAQNKPVGNLSETSTELQKEYDTVSYESQVLLDSIIEKEDSSLTKEKQRTLKNASVREKIVGRTAFTREGRKAKKKTSLLSFEDTHPMTEEDVYTQQKTQESETKNSIESSVVSVVIQIEESKNEARNSLPVHSSSSSSLELSNKQSSSSSVKDHQTPAPATLESLPKDQTISSTKAQSLERLSSELSDSKSSTEASSHQPKNKSHCLKLPNISDKLSNLSVCTPGKDLVNICTIVVQVNPIKEIQIKSGPNAGQFIPLSSIIVSDATKSHFKLTLWRQASAWTEKLVASDIIVATGIRIEKWRDEYIGQTTFNSSFYNLHQPQKPLSDAWLQIVSQSQLDKLLSWARNEYGYLFRKTSSTPTVKFVDISEMQNNTLVHFRGVLKSVCALSDKSHRNTYKFGTQRLPKIRAVFTQSPKEQVCVTLWGRQSDWLNILRKSEGSVFELRYLTAKHDNMTGNIVLHTTSKSTKNKLDSESDVAKKLLSSIKAVPVEITAFGSIKELLQAKFNGTSEIHGDIHSLLLQYENQTLEVYSHNIDELGGWCNRLTYVGCASCSRALKRDKNGIYGQCAYCVYRKTGHNYAVKRYFKNVTIRIKDLNDIIDVAVDHKAASKLFQGMTPNDFYRGDVSGASLPKVQEFVDAVKELLSRNTPCTFVISCKTVVDENSFVISRDFGLIDFKKE